MNILKSIIVFALIALSLSACSSLKINQAADSDDLMAINAINQIKESGIVVIFPTEHKKEKALKKFSTTNTSVLKDIKELKAHRKKRLDLWQNTKDNYSFSKLSIVADSLLKSYIANPNEAKIVDITGDSKEANLGDIYVLYTDYGGFEVKQNGRYIPNPFPNKVQPAWGSSIKDFLGVQSEEKSITRVFTELDKQLHLFYALCKIEGN